MVRDNRRPRTAPAPDLVEKDSAALAEIIGDPALFAWTWFSRRLLDHQRAIAESVRDHPRTAVRAGHAVGKSFTAAHIAISFLWSNPRSRVVTTAPTWRQVEKILWAEINALVKYANARSLKLPSGLLVSGLGPAPLNTGWKLADDWFAEGISTRNAEAFQGIHGERVLAILDEASGIPDDIFKAAEDITTGPTDRILAIGNPTQNSGEFYSIFNNSRAGRGWQKIHLDCESMPWIRAGAPPPMAGLCSAEWIAEKESKYGRDHPIFQIHVRGNFADTADNLLLTLYQAERATEAEPAPRAIPSALAVDVADYGTNKTVFARWIGDELQALKKFTHRDPMEVAGLIVGEWRAAPADILVVDADGIGRGVSTRLMELGIPVVEFRGGEKPSSDEFLNVRTEAAFNLARDVQRQMVKLPVDDELLTQMSYLPYRVRSDGKMMMIPKEELRNRGYESPDCVDAAMMGRWGQAQNPNAHRVVVPKRFRGGAESVRAFKGVL